MAVYDIFHCMDYIGGVPTAGYHLVVDSKGRWTQADPSAITSANISTQLSVGNNVLKANANSLGFFGATLVARQTSVSAEKDSYTSVDGANSVTLAAALNILADGINSLGAILNTFGLTA